MCQSRGASTPMKTDLPLTRNTWKVTDPRGMSTRRGSTRARLAPVKGGLDDPEKCRSKVVTFVSGFEPTIVSRTEPSGVRTIIDSPALRSRPSMTRLFPDTAGLYPPVPIGKHPKVRLISTEYAKRGGAPVHPSSLCESLLAYLAAAISIPGQAKPTGHSDR